MDELRKTLELGVQIGLPTDQLDLYDHYRERHRHLAHMSSGAKSRYNLLEARTKMWKKYFEMDLQLHSAYYVKNGGNDSGPGSAASPWAHCPGMSGWTGSATLSSGDTVIFDNASIFSTSTGNYSLVCAAGVTYDGITWGAGTRAEITRSVQNYAVIDISKSNVTFTGFEVDGNNVGASCIEINYNNRSASISNITIDNCIVHDNYNASTTWYGIITSPVSPNLVDNLNILNTTVYNMCHEAIALYSGSGSSDTLSNVTVRGCTIYSAGKYGDSWGAAILLKNKIDTATIEFNTIYDSAFGIEFETAGSYSATGVDIRYNIIRNNQFGFYILAPGGTRAYDVDIYGNIFTQNGRSGNSFACDIYFEAQTQGSSVWNIYNNTFYSVGMPSTTDYCVWIACSGTPTIRVKNNIFYTDNHPGITDTGNKIGSNHSNNQFWRTSGSSDTVVASSSNYNRSSVTTWEATAKSSDPEFTGGTLPTSFIGVYGTDMVPNTDYFAIPSGKPAIDAGATLGSPYNGAINLSGIAGPPVRTPGAYDIGAYEYTEGVASITANVNDRIGARDTIEPRIASYAISYARVE